MSSHVGVQQVAENTPTRHHASPEVPDFSHMPPDLERVGSMRVCEFQASSTCRAYIKAKPNPLPAPVDY